MDTFNPNNVWLKFDSDTDEEASHEANIFRDKAGGFRVESYHTAVGQVYTEYFESYEGAESWLTNLGFSDFSS